MLHRAIRKYGEAQFEVYPIVEVATEAEAFALEVDAVSFFASMGISGYNMTPGGEGVTELTDGSRLVRIQKALLAHADPAFKERHRQGILKSMTPEVRARIGAAHKGKMMHPNAAKAIAEAKKLPENRATARRAAIEVWQREGYRERWAARKEEKHLAHAERFPYCVTLEKVFASTRVAAQYLRSIGHEKAANNNISQACGGKYKSCCGYAWRWMGREEVAANQFEVVRLER